MHYGLCENGEFTHLCLKISAFLSFQGDIKINFYCRNLRWHSKMTLKKAMVTYVAKIFLGPERFSCFSFDWSELYSEVSPHWFIAQLCENLTFMIFRLRRPPIAVLTEYISFFICHRIVRLFTQLTSDSVVVRPRVLVRLRESNPLPPALYTLFLYLRMLFFAAQAEYPYFSDDFRLKIFSK